MISDSDSNSNSQQIVEPPKPQPPKTSNAMREALRHHLLKKLLSMGIPIYYEYNQEVIPPVQAPQDEDEVVHEHLLTQDDRNKIRTD